MKSVALRQYVAAILSGLVLVAMQVYQLVSRFGTEGMHPRADLMQRQIAMELMDRPGFLSATLLFAMFALASHIALTTMAVWIYRRACAQALPLRRDSFAYCIFFLAAVVLLAMFANRWLFPLSASFIDVELLMIQPLSPLLMWGLSILVGGALLLSIYSIFRRRRRIAFVAIVATGALALAAWSRGNGIREDPQKGLPDVIVLGVDSLRPDYIAAYGQVPAGIAPKIDQVLSEVLVMEDVRTPLARTFVSYSSLLTGQNPINHGARFNLYPRSDFKRDDNLAWQLKKLGYTTMLAMDESRFANFDGSFGFDKTIVPKVGAIDFVVGGSFDLFATNLVLAAIPPTDALSTIQGNRAAYRSYRTDDHPERMIAGLRQTPSSAPLFLVSHLCLPHWPYLPGGLKKDSSLAWVNTVPGYADSPMQYLRAVAEADLQFATVIEELKRLNRLDNAILIVMSDHGEDFALERDQLEVAETGQMAGSYGHGSFALSDVQNHVVMGIQRYRGGKPQWSHRRVKGAGSVIDVAPTVADLIEMNGGQYEGISWMSAINETGDLPFRRIRYFENGLRSAGVERAHIDERAVADEMSYLYRVTTDGRFEIRPELLPQKLREKQRGAMLGSIGVMTDPVSNNAPGASGCWRMVDYARGTISCVGFPAPDPVAAELQRAVCSYYSRDAGVEAEWCTSHPAPAQPLTAYRTR